MLNRHSIRFRIAIIVSLAITVSLGGFALFLTSEIHEVNEREETAKLKSTNDLLRDIIAQTDSILLQQTEAWAHAFDTVMSGTFTLEAGDTPILKLNGSTLNGSTRQVDDFYQSSNGNVATIFVRQGDDFLRIATSVKKEDGSRAIGTKLGSGHPAYASIRSGKAYSGKATLFGRDYMTKYTPILDAKKEIIGLLFVGIAIGDSLEHIKQTIRSVKFGQSGYTYVLDGKPGPTAGTLIVHRDQEGKNVADSTDHDGRPFIKEMLDKRSGLIIYPWLDKSGNDSRLREKIVVFDEYKSWDWIIASGNYTDEVFSLAYHTRNIMITATVALTVLLLGILIFFLNRIVAAPLSELVATSQQIADGDLTVRLQDDHKDEVGLVMRAMHEMVTRLSAVIGQVRTAADTISTASQNLSVTTSEISIATERQAQSTASSAASLEEVTVSINEVSNLATATEASSKHTANLSGQSVSAIHLAVEEIEAMAGEVGKTSQQVGRLMTRSEEIGGIASVIREIADQTNLLALNAAIEAARAGEQGRGFAVVADEVRKLAERTTKATHEIATLIAQTQQETRETVEGIEHIGPKINDGLQKVNAVSGMLDNIAHEAEESMNRAVEVADATREQAIAANTIASNVEQIAQMTEETAATIHANAESAAQLQEMAARLRDQVAYFKVGA
ncbi:methyl-accepting chemotaxis protein [Dechloromonas agitata]|uniref:methyl-accepting chemotaxis protein n=1 Tax=Dechloromonas agitata TaxID=73030 RepID=UPI00237E4A63|nr:methyl-accepting chemotaxis protein [Dechloromonas agitata]MDE1545264.1 methyl-accepting chemotaxis protein [Dechloromonas agitata]